MSPLQIAPGASVSWNRGLHPSSGPLEAPSRAEVLALEQIKSWAQQLQLTRRASAGPGRGASRLEPGGLPGLLTAAFDKAPLCTGWGGPAGWSQLTSGGQHRPGAAGAADSGATPSHTPGTG